MLPTYMLLPESVASGRAFVCLPVASGKSSIRIHITTDVEMYISPDTLSGDAVISRRIVRTPPLTEAYQSMLVSEAVLARDWNQPDEDEAWAHL